jgi:HK97 family phage prohead protease
MEKILHMASTFKSHANDDGSVMIRGMASTSHSDRAGDVIAAEAWTKGGLDNFKNNPVILFNHDYDKPIGRATGVQVTKDGLELEAKISKSAPAHVCDLVKDGVLGAFSVGFKVKDADYIRETDGLMIKDAELFEVSVVSVPCNQAATFSLAKSFDSIDEYNEFKKTFTNRVDLTGQSLTKDDLNKSTMVSDAPKQVEKSTIKETKMSEDTKTPEIDLEAFAKKVADETAAKIAMKQAEQKAAQEAEAKAAEEAAEAKALEAETIKSSIQSGIETGVEKLEADMQKELEAKDADMAEVVSKYESALKEHSEELEAMRNSKRDFSDRSSKSGELSSQFKKDFLNGHMIAKVMGRKFEDTSFGRNVLEKAGLAFTGAVDQVAINAFEENVRLNYRAANFFQELPVTQGKTVIPVANEPDAAFQNTSGLQTTANSITDDGGSDGVYSLGNVTLTANRQIAGQFVDNNTDEQMVATVMPILMNALAHSQAKRLEKIIITKLETATDTDEGTGLTMQRKDLLAGRTALGNLGVDPSQLVYILSVAAFNELLDEGEFDEFQQVGAAAAKVTGTVANFYGSPVVVSDQFATDGDAVVANVNSFVIPRLGGMKIETDYEVANQRTAIVSSQVVGFDQIISGVGASHIVPAA